MTPNMHSTRWRIGKVDGEGLERLIGAGKVCVVSVLTKRTDTITDNDYVRQPPSSHIADAHHGLHAASIEAHTGKG